MPELPEVETVCRALRPHITGRRVRRVTIHVPRLRTPLDQAALNAHLSDREILAVRRRGKYLVVELTDCHALILHLGMTGAFAVSPKDEPTRLHERVTWHLSDGMDWRMVDARRFGMVLPCVLDAPGTLPEALESKLGPEPLDAGFDGGALWRASRNRQPAIKVFLLDQRIVAGIGNIYANEALFRARIRPDRPAGSLTRPQCGRLVDQVKAVLTEAIACGGTTISDYRSVNGDEGRFARELLIYGKDGQACPNCGRTTIRRQVLGGRSTFHCPRCQK